MFICTLVLLPLPHVELWTICQIFRRKLTIKWNHIEVSALLATGYQMWNSKQDTGWSQTYWNTPFLPVLMTPHMLNNLAFKNSILDYISLIIQWHQCSLNNHLYYSYPTPFYSCSKTSNKNCSIFFKKELTNWTIACGPLDCFVPRDNKFATIDDATIDKLTRMILATKNWPVQIATGKQFI
jgi:hypothetical protein